VGTGLGLLRLLVVVEVVEEVVLVAVEAEAEVRPAEVRSLLLLVWEGRVLLTGSLLSQNLCQGS
jgi:hypothetical protein